MTPPRDAIAAVTHPDPYPFYADLATRAPLARDEALGMWVAAGADAARAVLTSDRFAVRPPGEPVPRALVGTAAGEVFARLVRTRDGAGHAARKEAVKEALGSLDTAALGGEARAEARALLQRAEGRPGPRDVTRLARDLPARATARAMGVGTALLASIVEWVDDFVGCLAPGTSAERLERGKLAAPRLLAAVRAAWPGEDDDAIANRVGFLAQAHEATAGLIGNALVALGRDRASCERARSRPDEIDSLLEVVLRDDPPVHNTRRFVVRDDDASAGGVSSLRAGEIVLVVLAAAQRDPAARGPFVFGAGPHACPGAWHARAIAAAAVREVLAAGVDPRVLVETLAYRPAPNVRIPVFGGAATQQEVAS